MASKFLQPSTVRTLSESFRSSLFLENIEFANVYAFMDNLKTRKRAEYYYIEIHRIMFL